MADDRHELHQVDNDGIVLSLSVTGARSNLLFVHGLGSAQVLWEPFIEKLRANYRCWNLDLRGHGGSDRTPNGYDYDGYASDVAAALDHIGAPTVGIGHSLGGISLARVGAKAHPNLRAAYIIDSALLRQPSAARSPGLVAIFTKQLEMLRRFQPEGRPIDDYEAVLADAPYVGGGTNREHMTPHQLRGRASSLSQLDPECLEVIIGDAATPVEWISPQLSIPTRMIAADAALGGSFQPDADDRFLELTPHATIRRLDGVGHQTLMIRGYDDVIYSDLTDWMTGLGLRE